MQKNPLQIINSNNTMHSSEQVFLQNSTIAPAQKGKWKSLRSPSQEPFLLEV